ncbi:HNH endonuclease signature motif containing protein [Glutamicibacter ardleyensis]|uniref:HNH endonuclease signature motif containing protein n=1 Tax=Glutamicibacter ardleyensis TaxID=225894 RepID=UPI003FD1407A
MSQCTAEINNERCQRDLDSNGYCQMHRKQASRNGRITNIQPRQPKPVEPKVAKVRIIQCSAVLDGEQCQRKHSAKGLCSMHYRQVGRSGYITNILPTILREHIRLPAVERFALRIKPGGDDGNCWVWTGAKDKDGYGHFSDKTKNHYAHRWAWMHLAGELGLGIQLDHICTNTLCVRPSHLQPVTQPVHAKVSQQQRDKLKANEGQVIVGGNPRARSIQEITFAMEHGLPGYFNGAKTIGIGSEEL